MEWVRARHGPRRVVPREAPPEPLVPPVMRRAVPGSAVPAPARRRGGPNRRPRMPFRPMPAQVDLPALEHAVLQRWRERDVFSRSLAQSASGPLWTFYEGPPTANGKPGTHHVEARVFKDLFPRFKT